MNPDESARWARLQSYDFDDGNSSHPFSLRLAKENAWGPKFTQRALEEYRRFAFLAVVAGHPVSPSDAVDQVWHLHLLYTREYWENFCPQVLGRPWHHGPARGGRAEHDKLTDWYERTLASYRRYFGEPPADLWPSTPRHPVMVRVEAARHWVVPRPLIRERLRRWWTSRLARGRTDALESTVERPLRAHLLGLLIVGAVLSQPATAWAVAPLPGGLSEWPFDLRGGAFLQAYVLLALALFGAAALLRRFLCVPGGPAEVVPDDPYEIAALSGGPNRAFLTAMASLAERQLITVKEGKVARPLDRPMADLPVLERAMLAAMTAGTTVRVSTVRTAATDALDSLRRGLVEQGWVMTKAARNNARFAPLVLALLVPAIGIAKIVVGVLRDRPVLILVVLTLLFLAAAIWLFGRAPWRSRRGQALVSRLREENAQLEKWGTLPPAEAVGYLPFAVGLFGPAVLLNSPWAELPLDMNGPRPLPGSQSGSDSWWDTYGWGSSDSSSDGGGGDGGSSGCGGCGGD